MSIKKTYGLIGRNIDYSFSKRYFNEKFRDQRIKNSEYKNFDLDKINDFIKIDLSKIKGFNVTIPYKEKIIPFLDEIDEAAKMIGAVNTIVIKGNKLIGYNTDYIGFIKSFKNNLDFKKALIMGTGGASKAIQFSLKLKKIKFDIVSRKKSSDYKNYLTIKLKEYDLIINTSPLGTYPNIGEKPNINYNQINEKKFCYDLIYNPNKTMFLIESEKRGARIMNGLGMLKEQAEESWNLWKKFS